MPKPKKGVPRPHNKLEVPFGFGEDVASGMSISALSRKYEICWRTAQSMIQRPEVQAHVEGLRADVRETIAAKLRSAASAAADTLLQLVVDAGDERIRLEAAKLILGLQGIVVTERQELAVTSPATSMSDEELEQRLSQLRARAPLVIDAASEPADAS